MVCLVAAVAESQVGGTDDIRADRNGNKWPSQCDRARLSALFSVRSMQIAVEQGGRPAGNPDALLFVFCSPGNGAVDLRYCAGRDELNGSVWRHGGARRIGHNPHSHSRNRRYRGRSDDRQRPGSGNLRSETSEQWGSSGCKADEGWILTRLGETMNGLCESTVWGIASVLTVKSRLALCLSPRPHLPYRFPDQMSSNYA